MRCTREAPGDVVLLCIRFDDEYLGSDLGIQASDKVFEAAIGTKKKGGGRIGNFLQLANHDDNNSNTRNCCCILGLGTSLL